MMVELWAGPLDGQTLSVGLDVLEVCVASNPGSNVAHAYPDPGGDQPLPANVERYIRHNRQPKRFVWDRCDV